MVINLICSGGIGNNAGAIVGIVFAGIIVVGGGVAAFLFRGKIAAFFTRRSGNKAAKQQSMNQRSAVAGNIFADRDRGVATVENNTYQRITEKDYGKATGAETLGGNREGAGTQTVQQMLDQLRNSDTRSAMSAANMAASQAYIDKHKNTEILAAAKVQSNNPVLTAKEKKELDKLQRAEIARVTGNIKNDKFITEVKGANNNYTENLASNDIMARTANIRNEKFFTETKADPTKDFKKAATTEEKISELEKVNQIVGSRMNTGLGGSGQTVGTNEGGGK